MTKPPGEWPVTSGDLERLGDKLEATVWKHTVVILSVVLAAGAFLSLFIP